jgi:hypothetical protein
LSVALFNDPGAAGGELVVRRFRQIDHSFRD